MLQMRPMAEIHHTIDCYHSEFQKAFSEWLPDPPQVAAIVNDNEAAIRGAGRKTGFLDLPVLPILSNLLFNRP